MYGIIFFLPHLGATKTATPRERAIQSEPQTRNPGARKSFRKDRMVVEDCCSGALRARIVAPIMQRVQPIQPCAASARIQYEVWKETHEEGQAFFQEEMGEDSADDDRQSTHRRDKDRLGKSAVPASTTHLGPSRSHGDSLSNKVEDLPNDLYYQLYLQSTQKLSLP